MIVSKLLRAMNDRMKALERCTNELVGACPFRGAIIRQEALFHKDLKAYQDFPTTYTTEEELVRLYSDALLSGANLSVMALQNTPRVSGA